MKRHLEFIWRKMGSIHLTVVLCLLATADLAYGYLCLKRHTALFAPLNDMGLAAWTATFGRHNPIHTAWFFILLLLLFLLCVNTFACTTDRVASLVRSRKRLAPRRLLFKFAPHIMHYAVIVILAGYLCSYLFADVLPLRTLFPNGSMVLPGTQAQVRFEKFAPVFYEGQRLDFYKNRVIQPRAHLVLTDGDVVRKEVLSCNSPIHFKGYSIFLKDFQPRKKAGGMSRPTRIDMSIRKDPGVRLYLPGILLFTLGLAIYVVEWIFFRKVKKETS